ncbi:serine/threonine protein kinase [[Phormidium ambiguum] IAM M-71]|uniref:non-specific serine/threonine protein kinase n=1 Tax=[Phormidium ambiguum] IAM M-71 TaxID=454136 RepID=A0A1U7IMY3_9CYAN|nr:serine/threonine-protein kinase [Phormidium ambiguum]OKH38687.1 serine/threonine protein kinase [Phormidium ambiguum IAM M-71]
MSYCLTPGCFSPVNPDNAQFCLSCGALLSLKNRYRPIQLIGQGGFGKTFLALDEGTSNKVRCVVKQLYLQSQNTLVVKKAIQLFRQEAQRLKDLGQHPQIPSLLAHFEQQKQLYLVQEFIPGQTLEKELQAKGVFNESQIWELLKDLIPVLKFVHDRQIIHRDIKPANIIRRQTDGKLVLIDFGVAKLITDSALFRTGTAVGTTEYAAPEQMKGKALPASDLYSLGVTCIYLLTGVSPFDLFDTADNTWVWQDFLPKGTEISDRLKRILNKLIKPAVNQRYQSVGDVLQAITILPSTPAKIPSSPPPKNNILTNIFRRPIAQPQGDRLISEVGIDYTKLQHLLAAGKWKESDRETWALICLAVGKSTNAYLQLSDIEKLPDEDLQTIDRLWVKYSQRRFGFSVQKYIFHSVDDDYGRFCVTVGWPTHQANNSYLKFSLSAPVGHLPSRSWISGSQWWRHEAIMAAKLAKY